MALVPATVAVELDPVVGVVVLYVVSLGATVPDPADTAVAVAEVVPPDNPFPEDVPLVALCGTTPGVGTGVGGVERALDVTLCVEACCAC